MSPSVQLPPDVGDFEVPRIALDQGHAQLLLQPRDAPAQARLRNATARASRREAAGLDHLDQQHQVVGSGAHLLHAAPRAARKSSQN